MLESISIAQHALLIPPYKNFLNITFLTPSRSIQFCRIRILSQFAEVNGLRTGRRKQKM